MSSLRGSPIRRLQLFTRDSQNIGFNAQIQKLQAQVHVKNVQIKSLIDQNTMMKLSYEQQIAAYAETVKLLEAQLHQVQVTRNSQFAIIKQKYDRLALDEQENIKSYHSHEIQFLLKQIAHLRVDCSTRDEKLKIQDKQISQLKQSYERQLQDKIIEINNLNRTLLSIQSNKNKQIKQINSQRQLQRSRTSGIVESRKQNNQFMDRQIRKLNQEVLEKAIKIENLSRQINKNKRKSDQVEKALSKKIQDLITQKQEQSKEREQHFIKLQKALKQQILQHKSKQVKMLGEIDSLKNILQAHKSEIKRHEGTIKSKDEQIAGYKEILDRQREDHANQIASLMRSRKKRSSPMGSSRSLGSSMKDVNGSGVEEAQQQYNRLRKADSILGLATVKQEDSPDRSAAKSPGKNLQNSGKNLATLMQGSNLSQMHEGHSPQQQNQAVKIIIHYDALIDELKRSHSSQIQLLNHKINKLIKSVDEKQHQMLDVLTRFSPLVKIHAQEKTLQEDRRERIQRHWKADLALLQIMLDKYKIKAYE